MEIEKNTAAFQTNQQQIPCPSNYRSRLHVCGGGEGRMTAFRAFGAEAVRGGGVTSLWLGDDYYTVIADPVIAEIVVKTCLEKGDFMSIFSHLLGTGSLIAPVNVWRPRRKVVAPNFSAKNLQSFVEVFSQQSAVTAEQLSAVADKRPFSIWTYYNAYSMDAACESALGVKVRAQQQPEMPFLAAFEEYCRLTAARMCRPWLQPLHELLPDFAKMKKHKKFICNYVDQIIECKRREQKLNETAKGGCKSLLDMLVEPAGRNRSGLNDLEVREETLVAVLAATDTSAVGASFTSVLLSRYSDVQDKVHQELSDVFGDSDRLVLPADLTKLKYLEAVIKESLRLYPPVAIIGRKLDKDVTLSSGLILVKDSGAIINIWALHRNPQYWGRNAEQFRPERFLDSPPKLPAMYMPFSHGPRNCTGYQFAMMSIKTVLATVLRRYRLLPPEPAASEEQLRQPLRVSYDIMMRNVDNYIVRLEPL